MISVQQAKELIQKHCPVLPSATVLLNGLQGLTLAEDIYATNDFPPFPQSAMDGYAFCFDGWKNQPLAIIGEMQAGSASNVHVEKNNAIRIFTGAPLPPNVDTVVMQEKASVDNEMLTICDNLITKGKNVRPKGSEIKSGALALSKGTYLSAGAVGFIAGLGLKEVSAIPKPKVSIIVTGKELQTPGQPLQYGQVYESNSYALTAALVQVGITDVTTTWADDDINELTEIIKKALSNSDILLLTGGVSVGDYDFVTAALSENNVVTIFHKVKQKPGKPLYFGKKENKIIFGLPGNPSSVLTCYYEYVTIAIEKMMTAHIPFIKSLQLPLEKGYNKGAGLTHFLKALIIKGEVHILDSQESYKMNSFARANCLVVMNEEKTEIKKGELAEVHLLF